MANAKVVAQSIYNYYYPTVGQAHASADVLIGSPDLLGSLQQATCDVDLSAAITDPSLAVKAIKDSIISYCAFGITPGVTVTYSDITLWQFPERVTTQLSGLSFKANGANGTQVSATQSSTVRFGVSTSATATIAGSASSMIVLKKCATNSATESDWIACGPSGTSQAYSLAVAIQGVAGSQSELLTELPIGWWYKLEQSGTGTHTESILYGESTVY